MRFSLCLLGGLLIASTTDALYMGNPSSPEMPEDGFFIPSNATMGAMTGYVGDIVFSRGMVVRSKNSQASHTISSFDSYMNGGSLTVDFANRVNVYGALGNYKLKFSEKVNGSDHVHISSEHHIAYIFGIKTVAACWGDVQMGFDAKAFFSYPSIDSITVNNSYVNPTGSISDRQWQVGVGVSRRVSWFVPYVGLTYSHARLKFISLNSLEEYFPSKNIRLMNKYSFGFNLGFGIGLDKDFAFNVEARMIEETGASVSADIRF